jgi:hypothetical protein
MMENRKNPDEMTSDERINEIAAIIFQALMRSRTFQKSNMHTM